LLGLEVIGYVYTTYNLLVYLIIEDRTPIVLARRILHCTEVVLRAFPFNIFIFCNVKSAMNDNAEYRFPVDYFERDDVIPPEHIVMTFYLSIN
jgi:hypothetical protein